MVGHELVVSCGLYREIALARWYSDGSFFSMGLCIVRQKVRDFKRRRKLSIQAYVA